MINIIHYSNIQLIKIRNKQKSCIWYSKKLIPNQPCFYQTNRAYQFMKLLILLLSIICSSQMHSPKITSTFINNFLVYPNQTHSIRQQFMVPKTPYQIQTTSKNTIETEFKLLNSATFDDKVLNLQHLKQNRYSNIFAYEHSRVNLPQIQNYYINANEINSIVDNQPYAIFSQAPFKQYDSFWEAVYYKNVSKVIMLCMFIDPKRGYQSEQYWPNEGESKIFSNQKLKVISLSSKKLNEEFTERIFRIEGPKGEKTITHYHWVGWSDLKRPLEHHLDKFEFLINLCQEQIKNGRITWIHCSAGIGRTGTLGGVVDGLRWLRANKKVSIFGLVENMRKYRFHAVQTLEQYQFLYSYFGSQKL